MNVVLPPNTAMGTFDVSAGLPRLCVAVLAALVEFHVAAREADITHARQRNTVVAVGDPHVVERWVRESYDCCLNATQ